MSYKTTVAAIVAAVGLLSFAAHAQDDGSNFSRDRNTSVTQRIPAGYEPLGLKVGSFNVAPTLGIGLEKNDNIYYQTLNKTGDLITQVAPSVTISSDWGRHQLTAVLSADYDDYEKHTSENTLEWNAALAGRLDVHGANYLFGGLGFSQNYEPPFAPSTLALTEIVRPIKYNATQANAGFVIQGNRLKFTGSAAYADYDYFNTETLKDVKVIETDRDYSSWIWSGRGDYAISPDKAVFAVVDYNTRNYRYSAKSLQDSTGYDFGIGLDVDLTNLVRGQAQIGYLSQSYKNPLYKDTNAPAFKVALEYFPTEMTTVHFTANRTVDETPQINASGYLSSDYGIGVDHELLRNFVLMANYEYIDDKYYGEIPTTSGGTTTLTPLDRHDQRSALSFMGRYLLNRNLTINGGYTFSKLDSHGAQAVRSFTDNSFTVSLGLQY